MSTEYTTNYTLAKRSLRERVRQITREEFVIFEDPKRAKRSAINRVQDEMGSLIGLIVMGVLIKLVIDLIASWIQSMFSKANPPPSKYQFGEPGFEPEPK